MIDIIFFAAVAIFIFFKLREQLGKVDEEQKRNSIKQFIREQTKNSESSQPANSTVPDLVIATPANQIQNQVDFKSQKILDALDEPVKSDLKNALQKTNLSAAQFLDGANKAFEMVLEGFAAGNLAVLKPLLSDKIFTQFSETIKKRQDSAQVLTTKIVAISQSKILSANIVDNSAIISVQFTSEQINYISNSAGEIIFGSKTEINQINDNWTFKKDCASQNPNWLIVATS